MDEKYIRNQIVKWGKEISAKGLVNGTGGNISVRFGQRVICSPSGYSLGELTSDDLSVTSLSGEVLEGPKPTKELPMHLAVYHARPDMNAVVHTHSIYSVTYACTAAVDSPVPLYIPSIISKVGPVKLIPFRLPASRELGEVVAREIKSYQGLLLENHGVLTAADSLEKAVIAAYEIEDNMKIHFLSNGQARPIPNDVIEKIRQTYGG